MQIVGIRRAHMICCCTHPCSSAYYLLACLQNADRLLGETGDVSRTDVAWAIMRKIRRLQGNTLCRLQRRLLPAWQSAQANTQQQSLPKLLHSGFFVLSRRLIHTCSILGARYLPKLQSASPSDFTTQERRLPASYRYLRFPTPHRVLRDSSIWREFGSSFLFFSFFCWFLLPEVVSESQEKLLPTATVSRPRR